jgi:hypothetical protein
MLFPLIYILIFCVFKGDPPPILTESPSVQPSSNSDSGSKSKSGKGNMKETAQAQPNGKASKKNGKASNLFKI